MSQIAAVMHDYGSTNGIKIETIDSPLPRPGSVIVEITAAGVNPLDYKLLNGDVRDIFPINLPYILGGEFSGKIIRIGKNVQSFKVGDRVIGKPLNRGAFTEKIEIPQEQLILTPEGLNDSVAATLPVAALTAWIGLFDYGQLKAGQTVLIQGGAGGVGSYAIPLAHKAGARVIATASPENLEYIKFLGADQAIDYTNPNSLDAIKGVDLVLDLVGGPALKKLWFTLKPQGTVVSSVVQDIKKKAPKTYNGLFFQTRFDRTILEVIADDIALNRIPFTPPQEFDLEDTAKALDTLIAKGSHGKVVIRMTKNNSGRTINYDQSHPIL
jgi:N-ethylmaleimide reductase